MKTRRTGPILVAIVTIFSLSAVVAPAGAAQAKDSDDALVAAGGTLMQENLTAGQDQDGLTAQAGTTTTTASAAALIGNRAGRQGPDRPRNCDRPALRGCGG